MLPVRIHCEDVREAGALRLKESVEQRRTLAAVLGSHEHPHLRIRLRERAQAFRAPVRTAIDYHPHRSPLRAGGAHGFHAPLTWVVAWDQDEMSLGWLQSSLATLREDWRMIQVTPNPPDQ